MVGFSFVQWCLLKCTYIDLLLMEPYWFPSPKSLDYQTNHGPKPTSELDSLEFNPLFLQFSGP